MTSAPDPAAIPPSEDQTDLIYEVASHLARIYTPDVDRDDVVQELWLKWYTDWAYIQTYVDDEDEGRGRAYLRRTLYNAGVTYCKAERAQIRGYSVDDQVHYSKATLRELLPFLDDLDSASSYAVTGHVGRSSKPAHELGDALASFVDISRAWRLISQPQRDILWNAFVQPIVSDDKHIYAALADWLQVPEDAARKRADRALGALQRVLGGPKPAQPRRKAISCAQAQAQTRQEYGGE